MSKIYIIKSNEILVDGWIRVSTSPHTKLGFYGASIVQNDMELSSDELNEWYKEVTRLIDETEKHFAEVVNELKSLREDTVKYIKSLNNI